MLVFSCEQAGKLLHLMIIQVEKAISIFQRLPSRPSPPEENLNRLELVLKELKDDYLPKHLQWCGTKFCLIHLSVTNIF